MELAEAKGMLNTCAREGVKDPWIGDSEQGWWRGDEQVAEGYFGCQNDWVTFLKSDVTFTGKDARQLKSCGVLRTNDIPA
jgi:hypothetical protein